MAFFDHPQDFDVIVIGGGHAGCEAALAASGMGMRTLLMTQELDTIAQMSCNPSIGGLGKGQIVRELDALGGRMAGITDFSVLSAHMLNTSRGAAVRAPRAQCDKKLYQFAMKHALELAGNLALIQDEAAEVWTEGSKLKGVITVRNTRYTAKTVILTTGTFLKGVIHIGLDSFRGGRYNHPPSDGLSPSLEALGFKLGRLKTGTPMRLNGRTIDFSKCEQQPPDDPPPLFSHFAAGRPKRGLMSCWITRTGERSAAIIKANLDRSPLYSGRIKGAGPRYCPSIEDKIVKFPHHPSHILFLEPEGFDTEEYYVNGLSTSLPEEVQLELVRSVKGLEHAELMRAAYAIEYDYCLPVQLDYNLETKALPGLFMAGQINGTTGYEEAAAQGLMAGINAALKLKKLAPFILGRDEAYIGVMIDDLISKGVEEPYRIFTSRAEYRLLLRQDNADLRLMPHGFRLGLVPEKFKKSFELYRDLVERSGERKNGGKNGGASKPPAEDDLAPWTKAKAEETAKIEKEYSGYITRNLREAEKMKRFEHVRIPESMDLAAIKGICTESRQQFLKVRPRTLAQAARIPGVTPTDIQLLWVHVQRTGEKGIKNKN